MRHVLILLGLGGLLIPALPGQATAELLAQMKAMEARIQALEAEVQALKAKPEAPATPEAITVSTTPQEKSAEPIPPVAGQAPAGGLP